MLKSETNLNFMQSGCDSSVYFYLNPPLCLYVFCCFVIVVSYQVIQVIWFNLFKWTGMTCAVVFTVCGLFLYVEMFNSKDAVKDTWHDYVLARSVCIISTLVWSHVGIFCFFCLIPTIFLANKFLVSGVISDICKKPGECGQVRTLPGRSQQQRIVLRPVRYWGGERRQTCL